MKWKFVKKLKNIDFINEVEKKLMLSFPKELRELILKYNHGTPEPNTFDTKNLKGISFGELLDFNLDSQSNILEHYSWIQDKLPPNVIPFSVGAGGDYLCYDFRISKTKPEIVYWNHEQISQIEGDKLIVPDHELEYEYYRLEYVANDLKKLLEKLYDDRDEDDKEWEKREIQWENFMTEEQLKELDDKELEKVNQRRIKNNLPPITKS